MRIVEARFPAADPDALASWYAQTRSARRRRSCRRVGPHHFAFHVSDLEPWKERLDVSEEYDFSSWGGARAVYFRDPEDNVGELIARPDAGNRAHARRSRTAGR